ncbi:hypothetical protein BD289DRAFT_497613 [Coniella lustricola]|uniref:PAC domain-containing protein n=1 Tax=Coniella lustricola TaxID=2025994 RepID=A0A2T2ZS96_9PEZI|nr:hypothetical protein BD289DRAFT_497613 [Coniella lustricola]
MPTMRKLGQLFKSDRDSKDKDKDRRSGSIGRTSGGGGGGSRLGVDNVLRKEHHRRSQAGRMKGEEEEVVEEEEQEDIIAEEDSDAAPAPDVPLHSRDRRARDRDRDRDTSTSSIPDAGPRSHASQHPHPQLTAPPPPPPGGAHRFDDAPWPYRMSATYQHAPQPQLDLKDIPPLQSAANSNTSPHTSRSGGGGGGLDAALDLDGFDLAPPPAQADGAGRGDASSAAAASQRLFPLERRALLLFSPTHLRLVFEDLGLLRRFTAFLVERRGEYVPLLLYYLDARKALAAIAYANAVAGALRPLDGAALSKTCAPNTENEVLRAKAEAAFETLANEALPAWVTSVWMRAVEVSIRKRINGSLPAQLWDMSEGLAEAFCLSDPSRHDCPILFASDGGLIFFLISPFDYTNKYLVGRNCRLLQGPHTNPHSRRRLHDKLASAEQHYEPILNYRRDGSPFMNLLMITPLLDAKGKVRYFLGAQVDVSGLLDDFYGFDHLRAYMERDDFDMEELLPAEPDSKARLQDLSELFNHAELDVIRRHGGRLRHPSSTQGQPGEVKWKKGRLVLHADGGNEMYEDDGGAAAQGAFDGATTGGGQLGGAYDQYLLVRPAPHLRILFASPSLRVAGLVQSNLMDRIGGSAGMRQQIEAAMYQGQSVTAKIRWITGTGPRWMHATPLLGREGEVGVWMVVLVDDEETPETTMMPLVGGISISSPPPPPPPPSAAAQAGPSGGGLGVGGGLLTPGTLPGLGSLSAAAPARRIVDRAHYASSAWPHGGGLVAEGDDEAASLRGAAATDASSVVSIVGMDTLLR